MELKRLVAAVASASSLVVFSSAPVHAHHRPHEWCPPPDESPYCINIRRSQGRRVFWIFRDGGQARRYRLCVTAPDDSRVCRLRRYVTAAGVFQDKVVWRDHFPNEGPGAYAVVWKKLNGTRIGIPLGFHVGR